ncbi:NAD(+) diphosphatase [Aminobacter sp. P9b]|uniref:NAD(+) diphosphatase n=1 Tax=Aminobacter TaxID=31988 RepID=UPI000D367CA4|nr:MULTISPECIES: NAD(+) diphosphatase [Aminobacter]AWC25739.1 NADH pyrophosphatase [Aminobacter sp. MSH1]CAI2936399.1 NADH pyrophosphatase [Aminobacter niigataensis]
MHFSLSNAPEREASQFLGFAGNVIDRQSEKRSDDSARLALAEPGARLLLIGAGRLVLDFSTGAASPYFTVTAAQTIGIQPDAAILLGRVDDVAMLAVPVAVEPETLPEHLKAVDFRSILTQGLIDGAGLGAMAQGAALLAWHATHRFCGRCGGPTEMRAGGYKRRCTSCDAEHFPRTDPVAIMLTVSGDRCLMGRGRHFAPGVYSALAGFIEPGETIEAAVRRETLEESGIRLGRVVYHSSQPWPFPYSLMIGCYGEALNEDIVPDTAELEDCRWFSRAEVLQMLDGTHPGELRVPPPHAIAHQLIHAWAKTLNKMPD